MDNEEDIVGKLKDVQIETDLVKLFNEIGEKPVSFKVISCLLTYTIPNTWKLLQPPVQQVIVEILTSYIGISNVTARLSLAKHVDLVRLWMDILVRILQQPQLLVKLVENASNRLEIKEIDKLLFRGKLIAIINEKSLEYGLQDLVPDYNSWLCQSLLSLHNHNCSIDTINQFLLSFKSFSTVGLSRYFEIFITPVNFDFFKLSCLNLKSFEQKELLMDLYQFHLVKIINRDSILAWYNLLRFVEVHDFNVILKVILMMNHSLNLLTCLLIPSKSKALLANQLLTYWSDCSKTPIPIQEFSTHFLIHLISTMPSQYLESLTRQEIFLQGISNHLESFSNNVKCLGVVFADKVCQFNNQPKIFKSQLNLNSYQYLENEEKIEITMMDEQKCWELIKAPIIEEPESTVNTQLNIDTSKIADLVDSDDESDLENDQTAHKSIIPKPLYIKQLLEYLTIDSKKERAYEMQKLALTIGPTLIRQKSLNSNEVTFYGEDLLTNLIGMSNDFAIKNFHDLILFNLISVLVSTPKLTIFLLKLLMTGDYSLQQRMIILSSLSLSCRELRGFSDDIVTKSFTPTNFPSQILPKKLHEYYLEGTNIIERSIQDSLMAVSSEKAQDTLSGGKILRISRRLTKSPVQIDKPKLPNFFKIVGPNFFFPLVNIWYESNGINIGHYSPILISHYMKTLTLILSTAYPSASDLQDMIKEFLLIVAPYLNTVLLDQIPSIESVVTGLLLICDISDGEFLVQNFNNELILIENWLNTHWEQIIDSRVRSLCSGLLLHLHEIGEKFERTVMSQINGLY